MIKIYLDKNAQKKEGQIEEFLNSLCRNPNIANTGFEILYDDHCWFDGCDDYTGIELLSGINKILGEVGNESTDN